MLGGVLPLEAEVAGVAPGRHRAEHREVREQPGRDRLGAHHPLDRREPDDGAVRAPDRRFQGQAGRRVRRDLRAPAGGHHPVLGQPGHRRMRAELDQW
ncbi:hypothetical protein [Amycolatopsis sp. WQ 127309]|uniref:hypothetical protein n=1 Tax=Amycolatopsis sp. WQ 127309 TaxID=2932773 RepID=UPI001FF19993|nr:hypothetical protein [Amycolatopsis sp. WQ 127309]UOZ02482.1 hypothetical protein MUY22_26785 [Amycolatopsis sp. WQ 127309]